MFYRRVTSHNFTKQPKTHQFFIQVFAFTDAALIVGTYVLNWSWGFSFRQHHFWNGKLILHHPEQVLARPVHYEMIPIRTILSLSEGRRKPQRENYQALAVKGERHPTCGPESRTQAIVVRGERVSTAPPSLSSLLS